MINGVWRRALGQPSYLHTLPRLHQQVRSSVLALPEQKAGLTSERHERGNVIGYEVAGSAGWLPFVHCTQRGAGGGPAQEHVPGMQPIPSTADICIQEGSNLDSLLNSLIRCIKGVL